MNCNGYANDILSHRGEEIVIKPSGKNELLELTISARKLDHDSEDVCLNYLRLSSEE